MAAYSYSSRVALCHFMETADIDQSCGSAPYLTQAPKGRISKASKKEFNKCVP